MPSVLFVCTANVCRSPMAAALFMIRLQQYSTDWRDWQVGSAGTWASPGQMAAVEVQNLMRHRGLDISSHRSREISSELIDRYALILTMEAGQQEALRFEFPRAAGRIFMLSEMSGVQVNVLDPMGQSLSAFEASADQIDLLIRRGISKIMTMAKMSFQPAED